MPQKIEKTDEEWRRELTPEQYEILRRQGTEPPFTGKYVYAKDSGTYKCAACGADLFSSDTKFDSGTGWPSFYEPMDEGGVELREDRSHGMIRTEVTCATCCGHPGHAFHEWPNPARQLVLIYSCDLAPVAGAPSSGAIDPLRP